MPVPQVPTHTFLGHWPARPASPSPEFLCPLYAIRSLLAALQPVWRDILFRSRWLHPSLCCALKGTFKSQWLHSASLVYMRFVKLGIS